MGNSCSCLNLCRTEKEIEPVTEIYPISIGKAYKKYNIFKK